MAEVRSGRKTSHWMWFEYPQLRELGRSEISRLYGIESLAEARAYLAQPVLGPRLLEAAEAALAAPRERSAEDIFGQIDAMKLGSSMTLFHRADARASAFHRVLDRFFDGREDAATVTLLDEA
jgi:uncharacterized protein (DUF1810 family)